MKPGKSALKETPTICRGFAIIFYIVVMLTALAGIGIVSYSWLKTKDIWQAFGTLGTVVFAVVISMLSVLFLTTVMGICGSSKRNRCCLVFAVIMMTFWALFFLAVGVSSLIVIPKYFDQNKDSQCISLSPFAAAEAAALQANNTICSTACPCYFPNILNGSVYSTDDRIALATSAPGADPLNGALPVRLQDCSNIDLSNDLKTNVALYALLENRYQCTGWCSDSSNLFYRFTDVNNGKPQFTCYARVSERLNFYGKYAAIISFIIAGFILLSWLSSVWYLCNSGKGPAPQMMPVPPTTNRRQIHRVPSSSHGSIQDGRYP